VPLLSLPAIAVSTRWAPKAAVRGTLLDVTGAALVTALASAIVVLLEAPATRLSVWALVAMGFSGAATGAMLVRHVRRVPDGFVPLAVVRAPRYLLGASAAMSIFAAYVSMLFAAPLLLLAGHDWTPIHIGIVLTPAAALGAISARFAGTVVPRTNAFRVAAAMAATSALGLVLAGTADRAPAAIVLGLGLVLVGLSGGQVALVDRVPLAVSPAARGVATGLFTLAFLLGGAVGSAAVAGLSGVMGLAPALVCVAALPAVGSVCAVAAGKSD
jgi:hypothetical protein